MTIELLASVGPAGALLFAYVDPGIIGALYQAIYVAIFGIVAAVIFKPWGFIKARFARLTGRRRADAGTPGPARDPAGPDDGTR